MMRYLSCCLLCAAFWTGCHSPAAVWGWKGPVEKTNINQGGQATRKIAFLEFDLSLTDSIRNTYSCKLAAYFLKEGNLRASYAPAEAPVMPYQVYAEVLDGKGKVVNTIVQADPLNRWVEGPGDDEGKKLTSAVLRSTTGKILVRFQYTDQTRYIRIRLPDQNLQLLKPIYYAQL